MTDMPERIFAARDHGPSYSGTWIASFSDGSEYIRADLVAAKDAEIDRLRALLMERCDSEHTDVCIWNVAMRGMACTCGYDAVAAYFREIEG